MTEPRLTHVDETGAARMVDVSEKAVTTRVATAAGRVLVSPEVVALLRGTGRAQGRRRRGGPDRRDRRAPSGRRTSCRSATRSPCTA